MAKTSLTKDRERWPSWSKAPDSKSGVGSSHRGFDSKIPQCSVAVGDIDEKRSARRSETKWRSGKRHPTLSAIVKMRPLFRESFKVSVIPVKKKRVGENPRGFDSKIP